MESRRSKVCGETACGFSTSSNDAKERVASMRKLCFVVLLCLLFMTIEVVGGIKANSLALLADAAHLLTDVAAFAISMLSLWASSWDANPRQSFGFFRIEILGALVSIQLIWLLTGILVYEAITRLIQETNDVDGFSMVLIAAFGLVVNIIMIVVLGHDHDHGHGDNAEQLLEKSKERKNINVQGAYLHVLGDLLQSIGVMIGGVMIWYNPKWKVIDLICTLVFSVIVLGTTIKILRSILEVLMESTPREIDARQLRKGLMEMEQVVDVHELHIWAITVGKALFSCHVKIRPEADDDMVLNKVIDYIWKEYRISHVTLQIER
ncbi:Metal tolerance protein A1 [Cardamine amara subsp. amara]|uniref:Metal tolerance protein A1 n=1 Tax=Cardamine amara subsp. amara TaxID=228776 RepID=A0ABD1AHN2_CARAN